MVVLLLLRHLLTSAGRAVLACTLLAGCFVLPSFAQEDPFGFGSQGVDAEANATVAAETEASGDEEAAAAPDDLVSENLRRYAASRSPRQLAIAIREATRLRRWTEVETFLTNLARRQLDAADQIEMAEVIGPPLLARMRLAGTLDDAALLQVESLRTAVSDRNADAARIRSLIPQIASSSVDEQLAAFRALLAGGNVAIAELVAAASQPDEDRPASRRQIVEVLQRMGSEAIEALQQMALYGDRRWRSGALDTLAMVDREAAISDLVVGLHAGDTTEPERQVARQHLRLLFPNLPYEAETETYLREKLEQANGRVARSLNNDDRETVWSIGDDRISVVSTTTSSRLARTRIAVDAANRLRRLDGITPAAEAAALMTDLGYRLQIDPEFGSEEDRQAIERTWGGDVFSATRWEDALTQALEAERIDAAVALMRLIPADAGDRLVVSHAAEPTVLVDAIMHPEPRVRYEAARAISRLQVKERYAGSSEVLDRWLEMAALTRRPVAVLLEPQIRVASRVESLLVSLGYRVVRVPTVRRAIEQIEEGGDIQWLVANTRLTDAVPIELIDRVRRRPLGSDLPILFYGDPAPGTDDSRWEAPLVRVDAPSTAAPLAAAMDSILDARQIPPLSAAERITFSIDGIQALAEVAAGDVRYDFYDLRTAGVESVVGGNIAGVHDAQLTILATLGTPSSQASLVSMAGNPSLPASYRAQAAQAFADSVAQFGTRLSRADVESQYRRYNQATDPEVRETLSTILDVMERQAGVTSKATTDAETGAPSS